MMGPVHKQFLLLICLTFAVIFANAWRVERKNKDGATARMALVVAAICSIGALWLGVELFWPTSMP